MGQSQGKHTLCYQQAAILNKPVACKIWQRMTAVFQGMHCCSSKLNE